MADLCPECGKPQCKTCTCNEPKEKEKTTEVTIQEKLGVPESAKILIE